MERLCSPHPEDQAGYEYPEDGFLQALGVIQPDEIRNPKQLDANREECLLVVKHGADDGHYHRSGHGNGVFHSQLQ
jgi:hypothetical protein